MPSLSKWLFIAGALVVFTGCRKAPGPPSPEYEEAYRIHEKLYVAQLDEAYGSPQMDRALELLKQVKAGSSDAADARRLIAAIELGKQQFARQADEDKKRKAALSQPVTAGPKIDSAAIVASALPRSDAGPAAAAVVADADGGAGAPDPYGPGASLGALNRELGGCLTDSGNTFTERGTSRLGQIYQISDSRYCQGKVPGLQGQVMLFINGVLFRKMPYTELGIEKINLAPGSGPKPSAAAGQAADAGAQNKLTYVPSGVPAPAGTQPINGAPGGSPAAPAPSSLEYTGPKPEQPQPTY